MLFRNVERLVFMLLGIECNVQRSNGIQYQKKTKIAKNQAAHYLDNVLKASMTSKCNIRRLLTQLRLRDSIS